MKLAYILSLLIDGFLQVFNTRYCQVYICGVLLFRTLFTVFVKSHDISKIVLSTLFTTDEAANTV